MTRHKYCTAYNKITNSKIQKVFENIMEQNINDWVKIYSHYILHQFIFDYVSLKVPILNLCTFSIITLK